jgi:[acyl-carrier-protein] S-malonyltransferase
MGHARLVGKTEEKESLMRIALFPGQGAIKPGMGLAWKDHPSGQLFDQIGEISGINVRHLVEVADGPELVRTDNAQLATFAISMVAADAIALSGVDLAIGHSLGEYSALTFAGILDLESATRLVLQRGQAMEQASRQNPGSMVAVLGADPEVLQGVLEKFTTLVIANQNAPGQSVIAGSSEELNALRLGAKEFGLRKVLPLDVGGAFHSPLMAPAQDALEEALNDTIFLDGHIPVVANINATSQEGGDLWRVLLLAQLTGAVRYQESIERLPEGPHEFVELGPGSVLIGLVKRMRADATLTAISTPQDVLDYRGDAT